MVIGYSQQAESESEIAQPPYDKEEAEDTFREDLVDEYYEQIHDLKFDFGKLSNIFAAVAFLELKEEFKEPAYEILSGIDYKDLDGKKAGTLDLVVWDKKKKEAARIYLVKASANFPRSLKIGEKYIDRFKSMVESRDIGDMDARNNRFRILRVSEFRNIKHFGIIGLKGAVEKGWEREVDLTREEAMALQQMIIYGKDEDKDSEPES